MWVMTRAEARFSASMPGRVEAAFRACVKNVLGKIVLVIVLVLGFMVLFEDEDEDKQDAEWAFFT
jgi:hypothetical protein